MSNKYENYDPMSNQLWVILDRLTDVIVTYSPGCIVEIGIGRSSSILSKHAKNLGVTFYTCDTSLDRCNWAKTLDNCTVFYGTSFDFIKQFSDIPSVVLLDGNHHYATVVQEFNFFIEKLTVGGVIFLHDTCPWEVYYNNKMKTKNKEMDTYKLRKEIEKREDLEVFTWPYTASYCGLTMVLKKDMTQPFYRI